MAWRLAAACLGVLLSGTSGVWVDGKEDVDKAALRKAARLRKKQERQVRRFGEALANNNSCFKEHASYVPLDMKNTSFTVTETAEKCQERCQQTEGCARFSFYENLKHCHLTDANALLGGGVVGFTAGPRDCREQNCTTDMTTYFPILEPTGFYKNRSKIEAIKLCQTLCLSVAQCSHFILKIPSQECHLADGSALKYRMYGHITGPPSCTGRKQIVEQVRLVEDRASGDLRSALGRGAVPGRLAALAAGAAGAAALAAAGLAAVRGRRRGQTSLASHPHLNLDAQLSSGGAEEQEGCLAVA